jgi:hypothetical protein
MISYRNEIDLLDMDNGTENVPIEVNFENLKNMAIFDETINLKNIIIEKTLCIEGLQKRLDDMVTVEGSEDLSEKNDELASQLLEVQV